MTPPTDNRSVTSKVLAILACFNRRSSTLTLTQISKAASISMPTAHRRVAELVAWGALERVSDGQYCIGLRLWEVAALAPRGTPFRELALPLLSDLLNHTSGNPQLALRDGYDALFLERLRGTARIPLMTSTGRRLPLAVTGVGLALLAYAPEDVQEHVAKHPAQVRSRTFEPDPAQLLSNLKACRERGYAHNSERLMPGTVSIGVPILGPAGDIQAAIGVVCPRPEATPHLIAELKRNASVLSHLLAGQQNHVFAD